MVDWRHDPVMRQDRCDRTKARARIAHLISNVNISATLPYIFCKLGITVPLKVRARPTSAPPLLHSLLSMLWHHYTAAKTNAGNVSIP